MPSTVGVIWLKTVVVLVGANSTSMICISPTFILTVLVLSVILVGDALMVKRQEAMTPLGLISGLTVIRTVPAVLKVI